MNKESSDCMFRKKVISMITVFTLIIGAFLATLPAQEIANAQAVSDYQNHQEKANIQWAINNKFLFMYSKGSFKPDATISQGQVIVALSAMMGLKDKAPVTEIPVGHWAKDAYEKAKKAGLLNGITIDSNKLLTKGEVAKIAMNIYVPMWGKKLNGWSDVGMLVVEGWMKPFLPGPKYNETIPFTRADTATFLKQIYTDKVGIAKGNSYAWQFHKSLSIKNGVLTMTVPKEYPERLLKISVQLVTKDNKLVQAPYGKTFSVNVNSYKFLIFSVTGDMSRAYGSFHYELPKLVQIDSRKTN